MLECENPFADLFGDEKPVATESPKTTEKSAVAPVESSDISLDVDVDLDSLDLDKKPEPVTFCYHPITGELLSLVDVATVVKNIIEAKSQLERFKNFENTLKRAALELTTGKTKTRRLSAEIDGEMRTLQVLLPDDDWPERELAALYTWCNDPARKASLGKFADRLIRAKPKVEYSPIKKEIKKLESENFPDDSLLEIAKARLLKINKGSEHKLPSIKVEGETLSKWESQRYGDGDSGSSNGEDFSCDNEVATA